MLQQCLPLLISPGIRKPQVTDLHLPPHSFTSRQHNMLCRIQLLMALMLCRLPDL